MKIITSNSLGRTVLSTQQMLAITTIYGGTNVLQGVKALHSVALPAPHGGHEANSLQEPRPALLRLQPPPFRSPRRTSRFAGGLSLAGSRCRAPPQGAGPEIGLSLLPGERVQLRGAKSSWWKPVRQSWDVPYGGPRAEAGPQEMKRKMREDVSSSIGNFLIYVALLRVSQCPSRL